MYNTKLLIVILIVLNCLNAFPQGIQNPSVYDKIQMVNYSNIPMNELNGVVLDTLCYTTSFDCFPCTPSSPLQAAVYFKKYKIVQALLNGGANVDFCDYGGTTALHFAASLNDTIAAKLLIEHGADVNKKQKIANMTPVLVAAMWSGPDVLRILINNKADCNALDSQGRNAIQISNECCGDGLGESISKLNRTRTINLLKSQGVKQKN